MKIKLLSPFAKVPTYETAAAAGADLYAATNAVTVIPAHTTMKISTDIAVEIPENYFGAIFARSGMAAKRGLRPANAVGVIDSDYRGPIIVALHNDTNETQYIEPGERIAQLVLIPYIVPDNGFEVVDDLSETVRGTGGFGSTGTH